MLIPGATCVASSIDTPSSHAHFPRFTSWWFLLLASVQKRRLKNHNNNVPVLRKKEPRKNCHDCLLGSVRIIGWSSWQPCTTSLALKLGSLGVKTQRVPTILRFGNRDLNMRSSPCVNGNVALCSSHFFHSRAMAPSNNS